MGPLTVAIHDRLAGDATLTALLATYTDSLGNIEPAIFTTDPPPGDATLPYIVSAGEITAAPFDTKTVLGRQLWRDVRCYAAPDGSAVVVEEIAERVRTLLHRAPLTVSGFGVFLAECSGPVVADEPDAYGRIVTLKLAMMEA